MTINNQQPMLPGLDDAMIIRSVAQGTATHLVAIWRLAPAVAFALHTAVQPRYAAALDALDVHIATVTRHRLAQAHERIDRRRLPKLAEFDLISGLTGFGAYLLHRHGDSVLLRDLLAYLVRLTQPLPIHGELLPGWWCPDPPSPRLSAGDWPGGHGNLGLAHGIAGPLALLATAMRRGIPVPEHADAINRIITWLTNLGCGSRQHPWWPGMIGRLEHRTGNVRQTGPPRPSWCYGLPGQARALHLAALALHDQRQQLAAEHALSGCVTDEQQLAQLTEPGICHGWAGLVQTTWRAATNPAASGNLATHLPSLYARMERHADRAGLSGRPGLLDGSTGVQLVEHSLTVNNPPATRWDACLLLQP